jgi:NitT/TauT family transport system permease protein
MIKRIILPLIPLICFIVIIESLVKSGTIPEYLFPAPSDIWRTIQTDTLEFLIATQTTLYEVLIGLSLSVAVGISVAIILGSSRIIELAFYPYAVFFQTVPLISIAPILVIWFGYGEPTVIAASFIVSVFPIIINTLAGIRSTDPALKDIFKLYGANRWQTLFMLRVPHAVPQIITGIRISAGLALIGAIVGEFIGGGGLGGLIDAARTQQRLDKVFAAVLISSFAGIIILSMISLVVRIFFHRWRELRE